MVRIAIDMSVMTSAAFCCNESANLIADPVADKTTTFVFSHTVSSIY